MFNIFKKKEDDPDAIRNLREIFEKIVAIKDSELTDPSDEMSEETFNWYEQFAEDAYEDITKSSRRDARPKQQILMNSLIDYASTEKRGGALYTFAYDAETQDNLPYWDRFPLVLRMLDNLDSTESFLGMNLHYLDPYYRRIVLVNLMKKLDGDISKKTSRIVGMGMDKLRVVPNKYGRVCIRRYKYDNIRGRALRIPPEHWLKVIFLPTYQFIGAKPNKVWKDSYKKIRKLNRGGA